MYKIVPNTLGPLVYIDDDNFLLDDILSKENYMEDDIFNEIIEHHLKIFTKNTMKIGWMQKPGQPKSTPKNVWYKFDKKDYNTKIYYYSEYGKYDKLQLDIMYISDGFFQRELLRIEKPVPKTLMILDKCFDINTKPTHQWTLSVDHRQKEGYKEILLGE
jgi:hypothetical protein|tara:strand:+ start:659 stop:1138 length:480 start_codon:yes stop_codon:yes gene_type:complete